MKRPWIMMAVVVIAAGAWAAYQAMAPASKPLATLVPADAVLYLEAKDFGSLLAEWNASPERAAWLKSDNYAMFSRSRLFLRLEQAQKEFTAAAGLPPDMKFTTEVAGQQSALAIYDIGKLEFVYVTRMPSAKSMQTAIWQLRSKFEPRSANGVNFYVHTDPESKRVVGFGATDDYLVLGTREDLIAGAMALLAGQAGRNLGTCDWYRKTAAAGEKEPGDLRMVLNLSEINKTPQFRTYWIQQNITEMRRYGSAVVDLHRSAAEYREERTLLPAAAGADDADGAEAAQNAVSPAGANAVADLMKFVPPDAGFYRAAANPTVDEALRLLTVKILTPHMGPAPLQKMAPMVTLTSGESGSEADLETRIDQPPASRGNTVNPSDALSSQLERAGLIAALQLEGAQAQQDGVFVRPHSVLVFVASSDWNGDAVRTAMQQVVQPGLTASQLGIEWMKSGGIYRLNGLAPIVTSAQGKYLFVSDDEAMLNAVIARSSAAPKMQAAAYAAGFNHTRERTGFLRFSRLVNRTPAAAPEAQQEGDQPAAREPDFFSENIGSLSSTLKGVASESMIVRQAGTHVRQTVTYTWAK